MSEKSVRELDNSHEILRTKLAVPRLRAAHIARGNLVTQLDLASKYKLTLLSAPAGFGKTTLVSEWITRHDERDTPLDVAWLSLDEGDNEPFRFWQYVIAAIRAFDSKLGATSLSILHSAERSVYEKLLIALINDFVSLSDSPAGDKDLTKTHRFLVFEDYHLIENPQIHESIVFLIDNLPARLHLILITRHDPPLPLARLYAGNDVLEIRAADLRFSPPEIAAFFRQDSAQNIPTEALALLEQYTEGWPAGLQLARLALQRFQPSSFEHFQEAFSAGRQQMIDYFVGEVLMQQSLPIQEFLLCTTLLGRISPALCDAVLDRTDSANTLADLERANLFLIALGTASSEPTDAGYAPTNHSARLVEPEPWYRYHHLFAGAMQVVARRKLEKAAIDAWYDKASHWYEEQGAIPDAIETALAGHAHTRAASLIERLTISGRYREPHTLRRWVEQLPPNILSQYPGVCLAHATAILYTSDRGAPSTAVLVEQPLQLAEQGWRAAGNQGRLGQLYAFRTMVAFWQSAFSDAFAYAQRALEMLPAQDSYWWGVASLFSALETMCSGELVKAQDEFLEARRRCAAVHNSRGVRAALIFLTQLSVLRGDLSHAEQLGNQILAEADEDRLDQGHALIALARIAYARNELEHIPTSLTPVLETSRENTSELGEQHMVEVLFVPTTLLMAQVDAASGNIAQARAQLQYLQAETQISPLLRREVGLWQARFALTDGDMATVESWVQTYQQTHDTLFPLHQEQEDLFYARVLIHKKETSTVFPLLEQWRAHAHTHGRTGREIEALLLLALAHAAQDDLKSAKQTALQAVTLSIPSGYRRLFLDEGNSMATLLEAAYSGVRDRAVRIYLRNLLLDFSRTTSASAPTPSPQFEPLSPQEERVLRLLTAGLSNPEIARELVVSINTVKTQLKSIYRKLDVHSRKEAREAARHLNLY